MAIGVIGLFIFEELFLHKITKTKFPMDEINGKVVQNIQKSMCSLFNRPPRQNTLNGVPLMAYPNKFCYLSPKSIWGKLVITNSGPSFVCQYKILIFMLGKSGLILNLLTYSLNQFVFASILGQLTCLYRI